MLLSSYLFEMLSIIFTIHGHMNCEKNFFRTGNIAKFYFSDINYISNQNLVRILNIGNNHSQTVKKT